MTMTATADRKPIDKYIPWMIVAFFLVVAAVDSVFVTLAIKTHTGTTTGSAYEQGLAYNQTLDALAKQQALGWSSKIEYTGGTIRLTLADKAGKPLAGGKAEASVMRPVTAGYDQTLALKDVGNGIYEIPYQFPLKGQWHVRVNIEVAGEAYQANETLTLP
ncbi:MAG: FixH family protein [Alphaproteobacteria bacterium]|nr:FixH family protein [Alphaproteobacteria bacterium]